MICGKCGAPQRDGARFCGTCGAATLATEPVSGTQPGDGGKELAMIGHEVAGRYRVLAKLGEGGMGAVYRAEQISLKRTVAVKLLRPDVLGNELVLRRFDAEAKAVAKLSHPNTVIIYDFGHDTDGTLFIAMELIEGRSLRELIQREAPLAPRRALAIAAQVAASLADAHGHDIVHRDLKPDNVMLQDRGRDRDVARVLDFGIAKLRDESRALTKMTQQGDVLGTPQYMAPEQIRGDAIDGRTDIYALGCLIYEMVTARLPHEAATVLAMLSRHLMEEPVPPSLRRPELGLPIELDRLVLGAMAKDPAARPPTMEALGEQIAALLATLPPDPHAARGPGTGIGAAYNTPPPHAPAAPYAPSYPSPAPHGYAPAGHDPAAAPPGPDHGAAPSGYDPAVGPAHGYAPAPGYDHAAGHGYAPAPGQAYAGGPGYAPAPAYAGGSGHDPAAVPSGYPAPYPPQGRPPAGRKIPIVALALVLVAGAATAAAIVVVSRRSSTPAPSEPSIKPEPGDKPAPEPDRPKADPWATAGADPKSPPKPEPGSPRPAAHDPSPAVAGKRVDVGQGVTLIVPPGFEVQTSNGMTLAGDRRAIVIGVGPLVLDTDDADELAHDYARRSGLVLDQVREVPVHGVNRPMAVLHGKFNGVDVGQVAMILIGPGVRLGVAIQAPVRLLADVAVQRLMSEVFEARIVLP